MVGALCFFLLSAMPNSKKKLQALVASLHEAIAERDKELQSNRQALQSREAQLKEQSALIEKLKFELASLKSWRFGKRSEGLLADQLDIIPAELFGAPTARRRDAGAGARSGQWQDRHRLPLGLPQRSLECAQSRGL